MVFITLPDIFGFDSLACRAKLFAKKRHAEKIQMKKTIAMHEEKKSKKKKEPEVQEGAIPAYLMDRCVCGDANVDDLAAALLWEFPRF